MKDNKKEEFPKAQINWYPGHMAKTKREIIESLKLIDIVLEIVDSRIPISSRNPDIDAIVKDKPRIVILNKCDLADENKNMEWIKYFENKGISAVCTNASLGKGLDKVVNKIFELMKPKLQESENRGRVNRTIRAIILGIPNVGKSSFINRLANKNSLEVGNRPGVTKRKQWIRLKNNIELLDTPGVLWPKFESEKIALNLAFTGTIKDEILDIAEIAIKLVSLLKRKYPEELIQRYKLTRDDLENSDMELINIIGKKRGCLIKGGEIDIYKISNIILDEFRSGKLGRFTLE